ncbi:hypothetical protein VDGE_10527 [Verticillium dahliae]|uniref:Chitin-binding type-1 domain-containing protein n=1 Tax=Verticillium dahliae TaxID=27337 RepID=A0A444RPI1_VERDA|nr:hypothetical protein VDGE_10527 [Verticillium dahliae]
MCGRSKAFCGDGCQPTFGNCDAPPPPPVKPPGPGDASPDGSCGGSNQFTCTNSTFGACCSSGNWCGDSSAHCGTACQSAFGTCAGESNISSDGKCGPNGKICLGSGFGDCCSSSGWCGGAAEHCGTGCQTAFGNCTAGSGSGGGDSGGNPGTISTDGTCAGTKGLLCKGSIYGDCCSSSGYCGSSAAHCGPGWVFWNVQRRGRQSLQGRRLWFEERQDVRRGRVWDVLLQHWILRKHWKPLRPGLSNRVLEWMLHEKHPHQ